MTRRIGFRRWPFQTRIGRFWRHEFTTVTRFGFKVPFARWGLFVDIVRLVPKPKLVRCPSTYLGVPCRKPGGHEDRHSGIERGRNERWRWTDDGKLDVEA